MSSYSLSTIRNFRACHVGWPQSLAHQAIWEVITEGWSYADVEATARLGVAPEDEGAIRRLCDEESLGVDADVAVERFLATCRDRVAQEG